MKFFFFKWCAACSKSPWNISMKHLSRCTLGITVFSVSLAVALAVTIPLNPHNLFLWKPRLLSVIQKNRCTYRALLLILFPAFFTDAVRVNHYVECCWYYYINTTVFRFILNSRVYFYLSRSHCCVKLNITELYYESNISPLHFHFGHFFNIKPRRSSFLAGSCWGLSHTVLGVRHYN